MGQSLEQLLEGAAQNDTISFTMASNQDDGLVLYATSGLRYSEGGLVQINKAATEPQLHGANIECLFSNRFLEKPDGQPFALTRNEKLVVTIPALWPNFIRLHFSIGKGLSLLLVAEKKGNMLVGLGPSIGGSSHAVYVFSFQGRTSSSKIK